MVAERGSRFGTVRVRTTAAAVLVVGLALAVGAVAMVAALRRSLTSDVRTAVELRAADVASVLEEGAPPRDLAVEDGEEALVQVIDADGRVVASTPNLAGAPPVAHLDPGEDARVRDLPIDDDEFLVVAVRAETARGSFLVLAGRTLEVVEESTGFVTNLLLAGVPALLLMVGVVAWWLVGRALAPVEAMRRDVDAISAAELHRRLPGLPGDDEIARLGATMNRMLERLESAQERQRRLVSDASHELRSPVTTIRQHAEVALAHPDQVPIGELAEVVREEGLRLQQLVDDLLFLARADEHRLALTPQPVDLDDLVFEEAIRLRSTTELRIDTSAVSAGRVTGDAAHLQRLVRNLGDNAARHATATVALSLAQSDGEVVLRVDDDGPGIPSGERQRVFERFVRLDESRDRAGGGTGLGLAIAAEVAHAHRGAVLVADSPLGGARLEVRLPARPE